MHVRPPLLLALLASLALTGCDALEADSSQASSRTLVALSVEQLPNPLQDIVDGGGTLVWEVQNRIGRPYASTTMLPAPLPDTEDLLLVVADASTCTPKCAPARIAPFRVPSDAGATTLRVAEGRLEVTLTLE